MTTLELDHLTAAVVRNGLLAAAREMRTLFKRSTMLPILYEFNDFGISIFDGHFNIIADAPGLPIFIGSLDTCLERTVNELGGPGALQEGDVILNNHPYLTAGQPPDAAIMQPIFHEGTIIGYTALRAHMGDVGGKNAYPTDTTELFQEGTIFPGVKIVRQGVLDDAIMRIVRANSRMPNETAGSILASIAAVGVGAGKVVRLVERYGLTTYRAAVERALSQGEIETRAAIAEIPDGTYRYSDLLDNNGVTSDPVLIECAVIVDGTDITIDLTGSAPEQGGPMNCPLGYTLTTCRFALKRLLTPELPSSSGDHRPIKVIAPERSLFNPVAPAPCFIGAFSSIRLGDMVLQALAQAVPDRVPAECGGDLVQCDLYLRNPRSGRLGIYSETGGIGMGAIDGHDGLNGLIHPIQAGCEIMPAELAETRFAVLRKSMTLNTDSGGPGRYRGGLGVIAEDEVYGEGFATVIAEKTSASEIRGRDGGWNAPVRNLITLFPGTDRELRLGKASPVSVYPGDVAIVQAGGGGGLGDPLERDPEAVLHDVINEYVSVGAARDAYGVIVDKQRKTVDHEATRALRLDLVRSRADERVA